MKYRKISWYMSWLYCMILLPVMYLQSFGWKKSAFSALKHFLAEASPKVADLTPRASRKAGCGKVFWLVVSNMFDFQNGNDDQMIMSFFFNLMIPSFCSNWWWWWWSPTPAICQLDCKHKSALVLGQSGNLCRGHLLVPQTVCRWEVHDIHVILAGWINCLWHWFF